MSHVILLLLVVVRPNRATRKQDNGSSRRKRNKVWDKACQISEKAPTSPNPMSSHQKVHPTPSRAQWEQGTVRKVVNAHVDCQGSFSTSRIFQMHRGVRFREGPGFRVQVHSKPEILNPITHKPLTLNPKSHKP